MQMSNLTLTNDKQTNDKPLRLNKTPNDKLKTKKIAKQNERKKK